MLQDVALKLDAFDYLQLPFAVRSGCIGRLEVQARSAAVACTRTARILADGRPCT